MSGSQPGKDSALSGQSPEAMWQATDSDRAHVAGIVEKSGTSFYWGMRLLSHAQRHAMYSIYAFCREVDDIADSFAPCAQRLEELAVWRQRIDRLHAGRPDHPITRALLVPVGDYCLPQKEFMAVIDGMEMDARESMRWPGLDELDLYCRRVAGAVGVLSTHVFGETSQAGHEHAVALGHAFQLTNILRDIDQDARRDRLYLPREDLYACGVEDASPDEVLGDPALPAVCARLASRARESFNIADQLYQQCDPKKLRPARIMRVIYLKILDKLEQRGWDQRNQAVTIPGWRKAWLGLAELWG